MNDLSKIPNSLTNSRALNGRSIMKLSNCPFLDYGLAFPCICTFTFKNCLANMLFKMSAHISSDTMGYYI